MSTATLNWPEGASIFKNGKFYTLSGKPVGHAGVALDAAPTINDAEVKAKIARAKAKVALDAEEDALAELRVGLMMPTLRAMVMDDIEAEKAVLNEAEQGEAEDEDFDIEDLQHYGGSYEDRLSATKAYWNNVNRRNAERTKAASSGRYAPAGNRKQAQAADALTQTNAAKAKSYSMFTSSAQLCKASK